MRRRAVLVSVLSLAVATATTLLALGVALTDDPATAIPVTSATIQARAYVDAVQIALETGSTAAIEAIVAADFVDHAPIATEGAGRDGLMRTLLTIRAAFTGLEVTAEDVVAGGDRVAVRLAFHGSRHSDLHGPPLEPASVTWREIDILRIADGAIVERWTAGDGVGLFWEVGPPVLAQVAGPAMVALARFTYAPGTESAGLTLPGPGLLVVERGILTVEGGAWVAIGRPARDGSGDDPTIVPDGTEAMAEPGDAIVLPLGVGAVRNDGATPVMALGVALFAPPNLDSIGSAYVPSNGGAITGAAPALALVLAGFADSRELPPGVIVEPIARMAVTTLPNGPVTVGLGRAVLPPGIGLPLRNVPGLALLAVEAEGMDLDQTETAGTVRDSGDGPLELLIAVVAPAPAPV
jgi:predicted ester cyclase